MGYPETVKWLLEKVIPEHIDKAIVTLDGKVVGTALTAITDLFGTGGGPVRKMRAELCQSVLAAPTPPDLDLVMHIAPRNEPSPGTYAGVFEEWTQGERVLVNIANRVSRFPMSSYPPDVAALLSVILSRCPGAYTERVKTGHGVLVSFYNRWALKRFSAISAVIQTDMAREIAAFDMSKSAQRLISRRLNELRAEVCTEVCTKVCAKKRPVDHSDEHSDERPRKRCRVM